MRSCSSGISRRGFHGGDGFGHGARFGASRTIDKEGVVGIGGGGDSDLVMVKVNQTPLQHQKGQRKEEITNAV
ncbi:hypothetical protein ACH5RR_041359 [Cinchona calisaya]|uniref:Obg domain-containing protein n=1 Tax=Cinchona calisaya TaxID=153742 RepID=A0ABD2XTI4_9GENT